MTPPMPTQRRWEPRNLPLSALAPRTPDQLVAVINSADVEHHPRYQPEGGATWCNIFVWDVSRALLGERDCAPHWVSRQNAPCPMFKGRELSADALCVWLSTVGPTFGWHQASPAEAHVSAIHGCVALATWENPVDDRPGHVAVVLPDPDEIRIAQAGRTCFANGPLARGFGSRPVTFFVHA